MSGEKIKQFLNKNKIKYATIRHSPAFTSQEIASIAHISGKELAKTVIIKLDDKLVMVVLPGNAHVNLDVLKEKTHAGNAKLAQEYEFQDKFPECEVGAMPPFGNLYKMDVYVTKDLSEDKNIAFNAGNHAELIQLKYDDFERLVKPKVIEM